jgi:hypothetical protein
VDVFSCRVEGEGQRTRAGCLDSTLLVSRASNQLLNSPARCQRPGGCEQEFASGTAQLLTAPARYQLARHGIADTQDVDRRFEDEPLDGGERSRGNTRASRRFYLRLRVERAADSRKVSRRVAPLNRAGARDLSPAFWMVSGEYGAGREALSPFRVVVEGQEPAKATAVKGARLPSPERGDGRAMGRGGGGVGVGGWNARPVRETGVFGKGACRSSAQRASNLCWWTFLDRGGFASWKRNVFVMGARNSRREASVLTDAPPGSSAHPKPAPHSVAAPRTPRRPPFSTPSSAAWNNSSSLRNPNSPPSASEKETSAPSQRRCKGCVHNCCG